MAGSNRRWNQSLFPIDDGLIEQLIDEYRSGAEDETDDALPVDDPFETEVEDDCDPILYFVESSDGDEQADGAPIDDSALDAPSADEVHALNMRVLDDYLRRRLIDEPAPIAHTLH